MRTTNRISTLCGTKCPNQYFILFLFTLLGFASKTSAQLATVNPPSGGFRIEGGAKANTPDLGEGDWVAGPTGSGGIVFNANKTLAAGIGTGNAELIPDLFNSTSDDVFSGSAFSDNPNSWKWASSKATSKCDINNGMYLITTSSSHKWMMLGGDRLSTTGTSYIDFEFYQGTLTKNPNGTFTSTGPNGESLAGTGGRTPKDFVLSMEYSNGGTNANVHYYVWENPGSGFQYVEHEVPSALTFGATNGTTTDALFANSAFGANSYISYAFVEAAVDIDGVLALTNPNCQGVNIKTLFIKTKASDSYNAALKDFLEPRPVNFQLGTVDLSYPQHSYCQSATTISPTISGATGGSFSVSPVTGLSIDASSGNINIGSSTPGNYIITYSAPAVGGCSPQDSFHLGITGVPSTPAPGNNGPICAGSTLNLTVTAVTNATYSWTGPNSFTSALQNPSISSTTTANGGTYYLAVTVDGCTSGSGSTTAVVNAQPRKPTLIVTQQPSLCSSTSTGTIEVCSPNASYTYTISLSGGAFGSSQSGSSISFSGLAAGTNPVIKVSNGTTGCDATESCTNALTTCPSPPNATRTIQQVTPAQEIQQATVKAYPNPFSDRVKFVVNSPYSGKGSLEVYNLLGQKVRTIYQGQINVGNQMFELVLPQKQLATLVYIFKVGDKQITGKLLQVNQ